MQCDNLLTFCGPFAHKSLMPSGNLPSIQAIVLQSQLDGAFDSVEFTGADFKAVCVCVRQFILF